MRTKGNTSTTRRSSKLNTGASNAARRVDFDYLDRRAKASTDKGYSVQKWIEFCRWALDFGMVVFLYESTSTVSKYVFVAKTEKGTRFKVRFSNHKPNWVREAQDDCDFFVGVTNTGFRTTADAIEAVKLWALKQPELGF